MSVISAPVQGGKRRHLVKDLFLLGIFASAVSVPLSPLVSSWLYRKHPGTWFEFRIDKNLSDAVKLDSICMEPRGPGKVNAVINYSQLIAGEELGETVLCFHVVPEDRANVEGRHRERGYNHFDFTPEPPLGSWKSTFSKQQLLRFPQLRNQRATIRLQTWDPEASEYTVMSSHSFDFAEFDRGLDSAYADHVATPRKRDLAIYLATSAMLLALILAFSRLRKAPIR